MLVESKDIVQNPLVTIAGMTYNQAPYIEEFVRSALAQKTDFPFEILISDDCSTDGTREIAQRLQQEYPEKIRLNLRDKNGGLIANYTEMLHLCNGQYIAQSSCDDFWCDEYKLQKQVDALETHKDCDLCYTNCYTCDSSGHINRNCMLDGMYELTFENHLIHTGYFAPLTWMMRREVVGYLDLQPWMTDESLALALDVLAKSKIFFINEPTAVYRCHMGSAANPIDSKNNWRYLYGISKMQLYYADKYKCSKDIVWRIQMQAYINYMLPAIEAGDVAYLEESRLFFENCGIYLNKFYYDCRLYADFHQKFLGIRSSLPYKLGKMILNPIKRIVKK